MQTKAIPATSNLSIDDRLALALAVEWLPFGGAPTEHIWVQFGVNAELFSQRLRGLLAQPETRKVLSQETVEILRAQAAHRCTQQGRISL